MTDDDLRKRLARLDPCPLSAPADTVTSPRAHELLERTMNSDTSTDSPVTTSGSAVRRPRRLVLLSAAAAAALVAGGAAVLAGGGDTPAPKAVTTLALTLPDPLAMSSCLAFDTEILRGMEVAFAGTARTVSGDTVTLDVTRWYKGGSADVVTLSTPGDHTSASLDSVQFRTGGDYLVTATTDGQVNGCGFSGEATPDFTRAFDEAFAG